MSDGVNYADLGRRLRECRRASRLTQEKLAERAGIFSSFVGHLERAEKIPSLETVVKLCAVLQVSLDDLILGKKEKRCDQQCCEMYREMKSCWMLIEHDRA